jgi:hypothetical protein
MQKRAAPAVMLFGELLEQAKCRRDRGHRFLQKRWSSAENAIFTGFAA